MIWFTKQKPATKVKPNANTELSNALAKWNLSQAMLADALGVTPSMVSQVASGERPMPKTWSLDEACRTYTANRERDRQRMRAALNAVKAREAS